VALSVPYPNPAYDAQTLIHFDLTSPCPKTVDWKIVTVANRLVAQGTVVVMGTKTVSWNQRDRKGSLMADGLYYFLLSETGQPLRRVKILLLR